MLGESSKKLTILKNEIGSQISAGNGESIMFITNKGNGFYEIVEIDPMQKTHLMVILNKSVRWSKVLGYRYSHERDLRQWHFTKKS